MSYRAILLLLSLSLILPCAHAKLYKWVDAEGNVHYSDKVPPKDVKQAREELSKQGVTVKETPRAKTLEEVQKEQELKRLRAEQQRLIEKQRAADRVLLRTFRSEDDIILARDGKLAAIDVMIQLTRSNIRRQQAKLTQLQNRAATLERSGKPVSEKLNKNIKTTLNSINKGYTGIEKKEQDKQAIRDVFARDLKRFQELRNIQPQADKKPEKGYQDLPYLVRCEGHDACEQIWKRAEEFVEGNATTPLQMFSERIIMTQAPVKDKDVSITVSRLRKEGSDQSVFFMDLYCKETPIGKQFCKSAEVNAIRNAFRPWLEGEL